MRRPVLLRGFVAAVPKYCRPQQESYEWLASAHARAETTASGRDHDYAKLHERMIQRIRRYSCSTDHIGWRCSDLPDYMHTDWARMRIFNLHESPGGRGLEARSSFYAETVNRVVDSLFADDLDPPSDLIHVSCTGYVSPSTIQRLIGKKRWNSQTQATHIYHMGCYAALPALRIASGMLTQVGAISAARAEVVHTELCTLHFNPGNHAPEQLVVQTLFADGYIRYSVVPGDCRRGGDLESTFEALAIRESIVPDSLDDMTWTLSEAGFQMTLSREVPAKIAVALPQFVSTLFADAGMDAQSEARGALFAVHPGGPRILDSVEEVLGLEPSQLRLSRTVLFERGNMSSATLPHIWMSAASDRGVTRGMLVVSLAFGPGLTIAGALFRKC